ncbi:hypothetical protein TNCV_3573691 [Trichonephila clavipes]|nr:hypothetical protein TNCV_3573691 [Trichonephila clavipes]
MDFGKEDPLQSRYSTFVRFWRKQGNLELTRITFLLILKPPLEKVARDYSVNTKGNIFNKSIQLAFADDIDIIARTPTALRQAFLSLGKEALRIGLKINENNTKYLH